MQILDPELNQGLTGGIAEGVEERDEDAAGGDTASTTGQQGLDSFLNKDNESQTRRSRRDM